VTQDTLSISVLETDIVIKFNSATSYNERSAFLRIFSFRMVETLVFTAKALSTASAPLVL